MFSITYKTMLAASLVAAIPFGGAYAAQVRHHPMQHAMALNPEASALVDQTEGVEQGIRDAVELHRIDGATASQLTAEARNIQSQAMRGGDDRALLGQLDQVSQDLRVATGQGWTFGGGGDGGYYPNGYGSSFPH
ncbi:MAG: hypothetical protein J0I98_17080 [Mesorhizobium sp.]|nr:hypothetical protein [Mesorhizobium sp.]MBN9244501.1 hypothetical protein [Mesorhizobium sp.]MBN9269573.1 hypothetical protein [Mesorhizobium sp.]